MSPGVNRQWLFQHDKPCPRLSQYLDPEIIILCGWQPVIEAAGTENRITPGQNGGGANTAIEELVMQTSRRIAETPAGAQTLRLAIRCYQIKIRTDQTNSRILKGWQTKLDLLFQPAVIRIQKTQKRLRCDLDRPVTGRPRTPIRLRHQNQPGRQEVFNFRLNNCRRCIRRSVINDDDFSRRPGLCCQ